MLLGVQVADVLHDVDKALEALQRDIHLEMETDVGPMECRYAPFRPGEREAFERFLTSVEIPREAIDDYLKEWDGYGMPIAVIHYGTLVLTPEQAKAHLN